MHIMGLEHARLICGTVAHVKYHCLPAAFIVPLEIAAEILALPDERREVVKMLRGIGTKYGVEMEGLVENLEERWAWSDELSVSMELKFPFVPAFQLSKFVRRSLFSPKMSLVDIWALLEDIYGPGGWLNTVYRRRRKEPETGSRRQ
jgi:hypothetical protein